MEGDLIGILSVLVIHLIESQTEQNSSFSSLPFFYIMASVTTYYGALCEFLSGPLLA